MKRNFELFMGCLGNGTTVCNKAVMEHGDYKQIAHISPAGNIKLYVKPGYIPAAEMERINRAAERDRAEFETKLDEEIRLNPARAYARMIDDMPWTEYHAFVSEKKSESLSEACERLKPIYLARA